MPTQTTSLWSVWNVTTRHRDSGGFGRGLNAAQMRRYRDEWKAAISDRLQAAATRSAEGKVVLGAPIARADDVIDRVLEEAEHSSKVGLRLMDA